MKALLKLFVAFATSWSVSRGPHIQAASTSALVEANTAFASSLYQQLGTNPGNLFFSPYSISTALGMVYTGARGATEKQMAATLHFRSRQEQIPSEFDQLQKPLNQMSAKGDVELHLAHGLWSEKTDPFLPQFLTTAAHSYAAEVNQADFVTDASMVIKDINRWVEAQTQGKIHNIVAPGSLDKRTSLVVADQV